MNKNGCRTLLFWAVCFTLPIAMLAVQSVWAGTYPFGAQSFLADDLRYQYIDFFTWYRSLLCGQGSIFYSFAQGMGSNTWGLYSYYLASPFNLVTLLFDQNHLTLAIYVIVALKLGCMQLAMTWYLKKRFSLSPAWALTLGLCYTWSTWTVTNLRNPLWLDALIILPLAAWCCHRLIIGGSFAPLAAIVAIDVITCWYMAYITLLFLCLFVLFELADHITSGARVSARWVAGRAGRFTFAIVLGLLLSSWTFVPTVLAMLGGSGSSQIPPLPPHPTQSCLAFFPRNGHRTRYRNSLQALFHSCFPPASFSPQRSIVNSGSSHSHASRSWLHRAFLALSSLYGAACEFQTGFILEPPSCSPSCSSVPQRITYTHARQQKNRRKKRLVA